MVLWLPRTRVSVMEPAEDAEFSSPSSEASDPVDQAGQYTVPPASPVEPTDPITAVQRANSPERISPGLERRAPRKWELKRPQTVQLSVKSKTLQNSFPAKPSRARFVKTKPRTATPTKNGSERLVISGSASRNGTKSIGAPNDSDTKLTSRNESKDASRFISKYKGDVSDHNPENRNWSGRTKDDSRGPNITVAAGVHLGERHGRSPVRVRRGSVALPVTRSPTYDNHPNLCETRPKSGSSAYRRVHYQPSSEYTRLQSGSCYIRTEGLRNPAPRIPSSVASPQPEFTSGYVAEIFQTSDKFLITRPESARQRPASARPPNRPKSGHLVTQPPRAYRVRPASALPNTSTARKDADRNKTRASSARIYDLRPLAESPAELLPPSPKREDLRPLRNNSPCLEQPPDRLLKSGNQKESSGLSYLSSEEERSQLTDGSLQNQAEPDSINVFNHSFAAEGEKESLHELDEANESVASYNEECSLRHLYRNLLSPDQVDEELLQAQDSVGPRSSTHQEWTQSLESFSLMDKAQQKWSEEYESHTTDARHAERPTSPITVTPDLEDHSHDPASTLPHSRPRTAATRKDLEAHFQAEKRAVLNDLRSDLGRRLKLRKKSGIMSDEVFQKQIRSSFWTADMLYHRWGNDMLELRKKWKSYTGRLEDQSDPGEEEGTGPTFPRGRRGGFSNERTEDSPLDFEALRSISMVNASLQRAQSHAQDTPTASPTTSQVSFKGRPLLRRVITTGSLRSTTPPPLSRQSCKVALRPQVPQRLSDVNVGLQLMAHAYEDPEKRRLRLRALFIETVTKIMRIARVAICMISSSKDLNVANFMAQLHFYNTRTMEEELTFEKEKFSRKFSKLHVPNWAREIGLKPPWDRSPDDVMALYSILKNLKSFERFTHQMRMEICRAATYSCCEKGRVVLRQGHVGHNFYFIFSGSVFVQIDIEDEKTGIMTPSKTHVMEKGASFGELALLGGGTGRRQASIICRETTELFEIEKETFLELCPDIFEKELQEKIDAAKNVEIFRHFPAEDLQRLCFESYIVEVAYGRVIERDTAHTDTIYFILTGKVSMLKEFDLSLTHKDASIQAYGDKTLPPPKAGHESANRGRQTLPQATDKNCCFMGVGELRDGDCTEIALLHADEKRTSPGVILISNGVRLMQMSKRKLEKFAPKEVLEKLRRQPVQTLRIPTSEDLYRKYLGDVNWAEFKSKVVGTLQQEQKGVPIVTKPATAKGSTGWARWPGSEVKAVPSCAVRAKSAPPRVRRRGVVSM